MKKIQGGQIIEYEPYATGLAALFVPYTGIIDYSEVSRKYAEIFTQKYGGEIYLNNEVLNITFNQNEATVITDKGHYSSTIIINTAGLYSDKIAALTQKKLNIMIIPFRGEYAELTEEKKIPRKEPNISGTQSQLPVSWCSFYPDDPRWY